MNFFQSTFLYLCFLTANILVTITAIHEQLPVLNISRTHDSNNPLSSIIQDSHDNSSQIQSTTEPKWSGWSSWSKCRKCLQKRMKICLTSSCEFTKVFQERHCKNKRCGRRRKQQENFHVVMPEKEMSTKMGSSAIWSSWTPWTKCSQSCRTYRRRFCRKPGRCKQKRQIQNAYCYYGQTDCDMFVFNLMNMNDHFVEKQVSFHKRRGRLTGPTEKCGMQFQKTNKMLRIIGGTEAPLHKWPWHVALINQYGEAFCGGTLIAPEWVLTASHCVRSFLIVRLNEHDLRHDDGRELELLVDKVYQHPQFSQRTVNGDIALLQLPLRVRTPVACLPNEKPAPRQLCAVMGWGKTRTQSRHGVTRLRETQIPVVEDSICKWAYSDLLITDNMMCAGWPSGKADTCAGDSGGGLMCPYKRAASGRIMYSVQGITSFGKGCGKKNKFGIYTVVYNYLSWIHYIMNKYRSS